MSLSRMYTVITLACLAPHGCQFVGADRIAELNLFTQFFDWFDRIVTHFTKTEELFEKYDLQLASEKPKTIWYRNKDEDPNILNKEENEYYMKKKKKFYGAYRYGVAKEIFPKLLKFLNAIEIKDRPKTQRAESKYKYVGTAIKLLIGICLCHGAFAIEAVDDLKTIFTVCKGMDDTVNAGFDLAKVTGIHKQFRKLFPTTETNFWKIYNIDVEECTAKLTEITDELGRMKRNMESTTRRNYKQNTMWRMDQRYVNAFQSLRESVDGYIAGRIIDAIKSQITARHYYKYYRRSDTPKKKTWEKLYFKECVYHGITQKLFEDLYWPEDLCSPLHLIHEDVREVEARGEIRGTAITKLEDDLYNFQEKFSEAKSRGIEALEDVMDNQKTLMQKFNQVLMNLANVNKKVNSTEAQVRDHSIVIQDMVKHLLVNSESSSPSHDESSDGSLYHGMEMRQQMNLYKSKRFNMNQAKAKATAAVLRFAQLPGNDV